MICYITAVQALAALADPTRRRIVELLAERDRDAGELAAAFPVTRPAVSRHLRVLRESGLVTVRPQAQRRVFSLDPGPLEELASWLDGCRSFWSQRLDALETELARSRRQQQTEP
jgi:DNA-binding transcriptional ArsR family regulator